MSRFALAAITLAIGCHRAPNARERALAVLPATATVVAAADGPALSAPAIRALVDVLRPRVPASYGCVVDAALSSAVVAVAADREIGITIVIVSPGGGNCPALSRVASDTWIATVGGGGPAPDRRSSVIGDPRWDRVRGYLTSAPLALAADLGDLHVVSAAQAEPFDFWVTIDASDPDATERAVRAAAEGWKVVVMRDRGQLVLRPGADLDADARAMLVRGLLGALDPPGTSPGGGAAAFECPAPSDLVVSCHDRTVVVSSLQSAVAELADHVQGEVISGGAVVGLRVAGTLGLQAGDVILGFEARRATSAAQLRSITAGATHGALAIRRGSADLVIELQQ